MSLGSGPPPDRTRIVIADDDRSFAEMLRTALVAHDQFDVVSIAGDGAEAVAEAERLKPDLILIDLVMPGFDGVEATRRISELPDPPAVILITGEDVSATDVKAYEAGAAAYLRKTQDLPSLIDVIVAFSRFSTTSA